MNMKYRIAIEDLTSSRNVGNDSDFRRCWFRAKFVAKSSFETFFQYVNAFSIQSFAKVADQ